METKNQTTTNQFQVRRGMVFFLDNPGKAQAVPCAGPAVPQKKRPYLVLSNDGCNMYSPMIHVAPIITRDPSPNRYYEIPFKSKDDRNCVVNVADIMLIPKELCNEFTYSESVTQHTIYNRNLFEGIAGAIVRQFAIAQDVVSPEALSVIQKYPVKNNPITTDEVDTTEDTTNIKPQTVIPNITLNISINGVPVSFDHNNVTCSTTDNQADVEVDVTPSTTTKETYVTPEVKFESKNSHVPTTENTEKVISRRSIKYVPNPNKTSTKARNTNTDAKQYIFNNFAGFNGTMSATEIAKELNMSVKTVYYHINTIRKKPKTNKNQMCQFIIDNYRKFNGTMTIRDMAKHLNISQVTIQKYVNEIKANNVAVPEKYNETKTATKHKKHHTSVFTLPKELEDEFVQYYEMFGRVKTFEKYKQYGFIDVVAIANKVRTIRMQKKLQNVEK